MKKRFFLLISLIIFTSLLLQGCLGTYNEIDGEGKGKTSILSTESVASPENKILPIQGTWEFKDYLTLAEPTVSSNTKGESVYDVIGKKAVFSKEYVYIDKEVCNSPQYKIKSVDTNKYLYYNMKKTKQEVNIASQYVDVISISSKENYFYDVIRVDDTNILIKVNGTLYYLQKISDEFEEYSYGSVEDNKRSSISSNPIYLTSGVILGFKFKEDNSSREGYSYGSMWLPFSNGEFKEGILIPKLIVPRMYGFQVIDFVDIVKDKEINKHLSVKNIDGFTNGNYVNFKEYDYSKYIGKEDEVSEINFIGDDYIALQNVNRVNNEVINYEVKSLDDLSMPIDIGNIFGTKGKSQFAAMSKEEVMRSKKNIEGLFFDPTNYTMKRSNGHWQLEGRVDVRSAEEGMSSQVFNLNLDPEGRLVNYDELYIPWSKIKDTVPNAVDAFISPSKNVALILTKDSIQVHKINNRILNSEEVNIIETPSSIIKIPEGTSVIMAEWAQGEEYVKRWHCVLEQFKKREILPENK